MKVRQVIERLQGEGWQIKAVKGSHRQFVHPSEPGKVTLPAPSFRQGTLGTWNSIRKQAGWK